MGADAGGSEGFFGERVAAVYDERAADMFDAAVVGPVADLLAGLAGDGRALEFAIGTGRIALPLAARGVRAAHLSRGGRFVIENGVPPLQSLPLGQTVIPFRADPEGFSFDVYDVVTQRFSSQHFNLADGRLEASPVEFRYAWPAELDLMARLAGMRLEGRWAGWRRDPFTALSPAHVSVYQKR